MIGCTDVARSFGDVHALTGVSFAAAPGTVHGILGENGAGKSTLMRILFGLDRPDRGTVTCDGTPVRFASPRDAARLGIGMVHQHFTLVPTLSVLDSCVLAAGRGLGSIDRTAWRRRVEEAAARLRWSLDPDARIAGLGVGQRQRVEIVKALLAGGRALILDEPTAVLTPQEVDELLPALRGLADGGATVLFISHKLHEVERVCDRVTILRRGAVVHDGPRAELDRPAMAALLVGERPAAEGERAPAAHPPGADRLVVRGLAGRGLRDVSFSVRGGEVVGIAGVDGNGQGPLVRAVLEDAIAVETPGMPAASRLAGERRLALIPDDRQYEALVLELPITANLALKSHRRPPLAVRGWLRPAAWRAHALDLIGRFAVKGSPSTRVAALSGGNQQKVVIARELHPDPDLVVAVNPTRGLDIAASADVMRRLAAARARGAGVLLVHHDLDELLAIADRVLVLYAGRLVDSEWPAAGRDRIGRLMLGADPADA